MKGSKRERETKEREEKTATDVGFERDKPSGLPASFSIPPCW